MPWHLGQNNKSKGRLKIDLTVLCRRHSNVEYMMKPSSYASEKKEKTVSSASSMRLVYSKDGLAAAYRYESAFAKFLVEPDFNLSLALFLDFGPVTKWCLLSHRLFH